MGAVVGVFQIDQDLGVMVLTTVCMAAIRTTIVLLRPRPAAEQGFEEVAGVQAVVGTLLGGLLIIKLYWRRIIAFLTGKKPPAKDARNAKDGNSPDK